MVRVTEIGEFIRHQSCDRRFKLEFNNRAEARSLPFFDRLFNPLDIVLRDSGYEKETLWEEQLEDAEFVCIKSTNTSDVSEISGKTEISWSEFVDTIRDLPINRPAYGCEVKVEADIGSFHVVGKIDFLVVIWIDGIPKLRIVECKASRRDRTYHRIQVALYRMIIKRLIREQPIEISGFEINDENIECVVARIDESTNTCQNILALEPYENLEQEEKDIEYLLGFDCRLINILQSNIQDLEYQLNEKCNVCVFNIHCLPESAIRFRLELLGVEPSVVRTLRDNGISDIRSLANIDLNGPQAIRIGSQPGFTQNLEILRLRAIARCKTLPGGDVDVDSDSHEVEALPIYTGRGQLPEHEIDGQRLIRIYLVVDYDYVENRIGALSAHITKSAGLIHTGFINNSGKWHPNPQVEERWPIIAEDGTETYNYLPLNRSQNREVVHFKTSAWTGRYLEDTASEREYIQIFLHELTEAIADVAAADQAPIHFYVWSKSEMAHLVEACTRAGSELLSHLNELLGCRRGVDQLIYSSLQEEINNRYALGWTGQGLAVVTSLPWFGLKYHWTRNVGGSIVSLDRAFTQDIFDFKTTLAIKLVDGELGDHATFDWARSEDEDTIKHRFEIRSRFYDSLPAPYWRALWRKLPNPEDVRNRRDAGIIKRYNNAVRRRQGNLRAYLTARTHALRWIEERVLFKNPEISKPFINIPEILDFNLGINSICRAAIDFLRLDQHVRVTDWISAHLIPPAYRISSGRTIPLSDVRLRDRKIVADIDIDAYNIDYNVLEANCSIGEGSFIRLTPCSGDPSRGQTIRQLLNYGSTCVVEDIDWDAREITLKILPLSESDNYRLMSLSHYGKRFLFDHATIDETPSDPVSHRVEDILLHNEQSPVYQWLDPVNPQIPAQVMLDETQISQFRIFLKYLVLPGDYRLDSDQVKACISGLNTRIQLLQGPPGTGKTNTTAIALILRIMARGSIGDVIFVAAHTHTAIDNLLQRIDEMESYFRQQASAHGLSMPKISLLKAVRSEYGSMPGGDVDIVDPKHPSNKIRGLQRSSVVIVGGTTASILKMWENRGARLRDLRASLLVIDEASMMVFPHFLALATTVDTSSGQIMLAGDHRQLAPIVAHDWENEDRPPVKLYQPFVSAYEAIHEIETKTSISESAVCKSALQYTFRLPAEIRELIRRLYRLDNIELEGRPQEYSGHLIEAVAEGWSRLWQEETGLYLVTHNERGSKLSNELEVRIIEHLLEASGTQPAKSIAVVTPHRGQRGLLRRRLVSFLDQSGGPIDIIDTVERLQGGQRETVIVSATESDPSAICSNTEFILDLRRSNVAFSRARKRLIVVCSESLLNFIPAEYEDYESTLLWKALRDLCSRELMSTNLEVNGSDYNIKVFTYLPSAEDGILGDIKRES